MKRREFIASIGSAAAVWPLAARAQQPAMPVIGALYSVSAVLWTENMAGLRRGLSEAGFVEGRNLAIEYRWADNELDRLPALAADLVAHRVAVIAVGANFLGVRAAMAATKSIPIVFTTATDPVATGLVASLNHPGGNVTGIAFLGDQLAAKLVELMHELLPAAARFAILVDPDNPATSQDLIQGAREAASRLGLEIIVVRASNEAEIDNAFASAAQQHAAAIAINDAFFASRREQISALALRYSLPVATLVAATLTGELMSYGANLPDVYRQAGVYVGRILKGEKPADLPVQQPTKFQLVVNLKTAKALGLTIPESFLVRADEVIE
jgi:putative tryptophan/tyrosine transport system substrate-binding protein